MRMAGPLNGTTTFVGLLTRNSARVAPYFMGLQVIDRLSSANLASPFVNAIDARLTSAIRRYVARKRITPDQLAHGFSNLQTLRTPMSAVDCGNQGTVLAYA